jgi:hypothetical protein
VHDVAQQFVQHSDDIAAILRQACSAKVHPGRCSAWPTVDAMTRGLAFDMRRCLRRDMPLPVGRIGRDARAEAAGRWQPPEIPAKACAEQQSSRAFSGRRGLPAFRRKYFSFFFSEIMLS